MSRCCTAEALLRSGLNPAAKVLDLKGRLRCRGCGRKGRAVVSVKWRGQGQRPPIYDALSLDARPAGGRNGAGLGDTLDAAPHSGLARPDRDPKPGWILCAGGQRNVIMEDHARRHLDFLVRLSHPIERAKASPLLYSPSRKVSAGPISLVSSASAISRRISPRRSSMGGSRAI